MNNRLVNVIAGRCLDLLAERRALLYADGMAFCVMPMADRAVIVFDTAAIAVQRVDTTFAHILSTRLQGRRVVRTNSRGLYLQVGYGIPPMLTDVTEQALNLSEQPTPLSLPIGATPRGPLWIPLLEGVSYLVAGSTGMGKTGLIHAWIQSMLYGGQAQVVAWDGKGGTEYLRYTSHSNFVMITSLQTTMQGLLEEARRRQGLLLESGCTNLVEYNAHGSERLRPIMLVIDEARLVTEAVRPMIAEIVERERATGICPVLCTNNPVQSDLLVKSNLVTRVSFAVPSWNASMMALGATGAEKLNKVRGRGLLTWKARLVEFQAFRVTYPQPTAEQVERFLQEQKTDSVETVEAAEDETARILDLHEQGKSISAIVREIWNVTGGSTFLRRFEQVKAVTTTTSMPESVVLTAKVA